MSHELGDISFLVALLQLETLDIEIGDRLTEMQRLNAVRKAYNERIAELQRLVDQCGTSGQVEIPVAAAGRGDIVWDPEANGGAGAAVPATEGSDLLGNGSYAVHRADGTPACWGDVTGSPEDDGPDEDARVHGGEARFPYFHLPQWLMNRSFLIGLDGEVLGDRSPERTGRIATSDIETAQRYADQLGGSVTTTVTRDQLLGEMQSLRDKVDNLSSDAEIGMLGLNRLLSRRNQVLQLASNVMSSLHQTAMGLIANLKV
ncbi:MAG: hypothetical protein JXB32_17425 [Deltaproteobacteria bacterium]|nr:hypothetical protein [Deltaproteobacteria bacterium]